MAFAFRIARLRMFKRRFPATHGTTGCARGKIRWHKLSDGHAAVAPYWAIPHVALLSRRAHLAVIGKHLFIFSRQSKQT
jgi:hypothetical protein